MLILKDLKLVKRKDSIRDYEDLFCGDTRIGWVTKNIFGVKVEIAGEYPFVYPYMFQWDLKLGKDYSEIIYGNTVEDCRNAAIEPI